MAIGQRHKVVHQSDGADLRFPTHLLDTVRTVLINGNRLLSIEQTNGYVTRVPVTEIDSITHVDGMVVDPSELGALVVGSVMGIVTDETGEGIADAVVYAGFGPEQTVTDTNGVFFLDSITAFERLGLITVEKDGYFKGIRSFLPAQDDRNLLKIQLSPRLLIGSFQADLGGIVSTDGLNVNFTANSIVRDAQPYTGQVNVYTTVFEPTEPYFNDRMPSDLIGAMGDSLQMLRSFGMADVEITDELGEPVQIAGGYTAEMAFAIPDSMLDEAPAQIAFWSLDSELGYWMYEGEAVRSGDNYVGQASHFSPWNLDMGFIPATLSVVCNDDEGRPITGGKVQTTDWAWGSSFAYTNLSGVANLWVRPNEPVSLNLSLFCETSGQWELINSSSSPPISTADTITLNGQMPGIYPVTGYVFDCDNELVRSGYIQSTPGGIHFLNNGQFRFHVCNTGQVNLKAFNLGGDSLQSSESIPVFVDVTGAEVPSINTCEEFDGLIDVDGNIYTTVVIGNQEWMAENLRTTKYRNGDAIPWTSNGATWQSGGSDGLWSHYNNNSSYDAPYGKLYNGHAVTDPRELCPVGWHVPTDAEWTILTNYLGSANIAGGKLKSTGFQYWNIPNEAATNESGFSAVPGGYRNAASFLPLGSSAYYWTSTVNNGNMWYRQLSSDHGGILRYDGSLNVGYTVRCIRD